LQQFVQNILFSHILLIIVKVFLFSINEVIKANCNSNCDKI